MRKNNNQPLKYRPFENEFTIQTSRSGGPGGQNVNKVETKVELRFNVEASQLLSEEEKDKIKEKLKRRITNEGDLQVFAQENRSQQKNKELAKKRFYQYLETALKKKKKRIATKPSKKAKDKRIKAKKKRSEKKATRGKIDY